MKNSQQLFDFFKSHCKEWIVGVDQADLDNFVQQYHLNLRQDHYDYLLEYGNSTKILTGYLMDFTYSYIKEIYADFDECLAGDLPTDSIYFGNYGGGDELCINHSTGSISYYYNPNRG